MTSYRPITDVWILARPKVSYYGAYPNGFLERARRLLGVHRDDAVLHVCGGRAKQYPAWARLAAHDYTLDLDPECQPDFVQDARDPLPPYLDTRAERDLLWPAILADPPYSALDADHYKPGPQLLPAATPLLRRCLQHVRPGARVGMLHDVLPRPPKDARFVACVGVIVGFDNRMRVYSVFERGL